MGEDKVEARVLRGAGGRGSMTHWSGAHGCALPLPGSGSGEPLLSSLRPWLSPGCGHVPQSWQMRAFHLPGQGD